MEHHRPDTEYLYNKYSSKIDHRIKEYKGALDVFCSYKNEVFLSDGKTTVISYSDDMPQLMGYLCYWWHDNFITNYIKGLSNEYKIASLTELVINYTQPVFVKDGEDVSSRKLNAEFGMFAAMNFIEYLRNDVADPALFNRYVAFDGKFNGGCTSYNDWMITKMKVHGMYMRSLNLRQAPPVVSNSFVWELFHFFYQVQWAAIQV